MNRRTAKLTLELVGAAGARTVDITGGAPELNPFFRFLVEQTRRDGRRVMDRCNFTVLFEPGQEDLPEFLASRHVEVVVSLPCYLEENVDKQRGLGVYDKSIQAPRRLNALGYGREDSGLVLSLVYNPVGAYLPPLQPQLETGYERELGTRFGIRLTHNAAVKRPRNLNPLFIDPPTPLLLFHAKLAFELRSSCPRVEVQRVCARRNFFIRPRVI